MSTELDGPEEVWEVTHLKAVRTFHDTEDDARLRARRCKEVYGSDATVLHFRSDAAVAALVEEERARCAGVVAEKITTYNASNYLHHLPRVALQGVLSSILTPEAR